MGAQDLSEVPGPFSSRSTGKNSWVSLTMRFERPYDNGKDPTPSEVPSHPTAAMARTRYEAPTLRPAKGPAPLRRPRPLTALKTKNDTYVPWSLTALAPC